MQDYINITKEKIQSILIKRLTKIIQLKTYSIKQCNTTYSKELNTLINENNFKCKITSYTNLVCKFIITSDKELLETIGEEETKTYFQTAYNFVSSYKNLREKYILPAKVHLDESIPHLHLVFVPVIHIKDKNEILYKKLLVVNIRKAKTATRNYKTTFINTLLKIALI